MFEGCFAAEDHSKHVHHHAGGGAHAELAAVAQNSKRVKDLPKMAADACKECEDECRKHAKHAECKACADACAACIKQCNASMA